MMAWNIVGNMLDFSAEMHFFCSKFTKMPFFATTVP